MNTTVLNKIMARKTIFSDCDYQSLLKLEKESRKYTKLEDIKIESQLYQYKIKYFEIDDTPDYQKFVMILLREICDRID